MSKFKKSLTLMDITPSQGSTEYHFKQKSEFTIGGMDCSSCALTIENHIKNLPSVKNVSVNFSTGKNSRA